MPTDTEITTPETEKSEAGLEVRNVRDNSLGLAGYLKSIADQKSTDESDEVETPDPKGEANKEAESDASKKEDTAKTEESKKSDKVKVEVSVEESRKLLKERDRVITKLGQTNAALQSDIAGLKQQIEIVNQKLDGTYEAKKADQAPKVNVEEVRVKAVIDTSAKVAAKKYKEQGGMDYVTAQIFAPDAPFRKFDGDRAVQARVFGSDSPVEEAFAVLEEQEIVEKYGAGDLKTIVEGLKRDLREELKAELQGKPKPVMKPVPKKIVGMGPDAGGENNLPRVDRTNVPDDLDMNRVFPHLRNTPFNERG
jgi:hypothetical protein